MEINTRDGLQGDLDAFDVSEELGFALESPLTTLPEYYWQWMDLANNLIPLIEQRQLRERVRMMPLLSPHLLNDHRQLRLAHLALGFITMGYVWQEGQHAPAEVLPKTLAVPYWLVSRRLGLPPILTYADSVLANWKLKDPNGEMEIGNLDLIYSFPGGESCRGFFLVSLLVETAASPGIMGALEVMRAMESSDLDAIITGLGKVTDSLKEMREVFKLMHSHVDPAAFHGTLRIFVSGWRDNPMLPRGLLYKGVSNDPIMLSGGSAAQSTAIQCFDALLSIHHEDDTGAFLTRMRDYMPPAHRQLIETLSVLPSLRDFVLNHPSPDLSKAYNNCVTAMVDLRSYHLNAVTKYIIIPGNKPATQGCPLRGVGDALNAKGTGGTNLMAFLKGVRDSTSSVLVSDRPTCTSREL